MLQKLPNGELKVIERSSLQKTISVSKKLHREHLRAQQRLMNEHNEQLRVMNNLPRAVSLPVHGFAMSHEDFHEGGVLRDDAAVLLVKEEAMAVEGEVRGGSLPETPLGEPVEGLLKRKQQTEEENLGTLTRDERREKVNKYLEKKHRRKWLKKINYHSRKRVADTRLRYKGRFISKVQASDIEERQREEEIRRFEGPVEQIFVTERMQKLDFS